MPSKLTVTSVYHVSDLHGPHKYHIKFNKSVFNNWQPYKELAFVTSGINRPDFGNNVKLELNM